MKIFILLLVGLLSWLGCARVQVQAPKDPIKLDISMRLDVYQHVEKDIDDIESIVSGSGDQGFLNIFVKEAYAAEGLSPEVEQAALRRRDRRPALVSWQEKGVIGENKSGLLEIRDSAKAGEETRALVNAENNDRMVIYQSVARKNGTSVDDVKKLYAKRLQEDAPAGAPIEVFKEANSSYEWKIK